MNSGGHAIPYDATFAMPSTFSRAQLHQGFTIIEMMIATAISLTILVAIAGLYLASASGERTTRGASEIAVNGGYALDVLRHDLLHAGYRGISWGQPNVSLAAIGTINNECGTTGFATNLRQGIWGSNDVNPFFANCIPAAVYATGDLLVSRHVGLAPAATLTPTGIYFRSAYERGDVFKGSTLPAFTQTPNLDYPLEVNVYFISPYSNSTTENPRLPALKRVSLGANGESAQPAMNVQLVAENIEDMQLQYARMTTDGKMRFYSANQISATTTPSEWDDVTAVRVWLLVRGSTREPGYVNTSTYTLGDKSITVNDGFRREVFSTVVQLRNH